jgi:homogentisate 1,2-dioxygenase
MAALDQPDARRRARCTPANITEAAMNVETPSGFQQYGPANLPSAVYPGYMSGFGNTFETEALPGALPIGMNSPQKVNYGLYETRFPQRLTKYAAQLPELQDDYIDCWKGLKKHFNPNLREPG